MFEIRKNLDLRKILVTILRGDSLYNLAWAILAETSGALPRFCSYKKDNRRTNLLLASPQVFGAVYILGFYNKYESNIQKEISIENGFLKVCRIESIQVTAHPIESIFSRLLYL